MIDAQVGNIRLAVRPGHERGRRGDTRVFGTPVTREFWHFYVDANRKHPIWRSQPEGRLFRDHALILRLSDNLFNEAVSLPEFNDVMAIGRLLGFLDGLRIVSTGENSHAGNLSAGSDRINTILGRPLATSRVGGHVQPVFNSAEFALIGDFIGARRRQQRKGAHQPRRRSAVAAI